MVTSVENPGEEPLKLARAPIVEAVVDIRCDMPPAFDLAALETTARELFCAQYPKMQKQLIEQHSFVKQGHEPATISATQGLQAFQFLSDDGRQLMQVRTEGFSFNRLAPYTSLDDYLPEIERGWHLFVGLAAPIQVREVRLRYINRLPLPTVDGRVEFDDYLKIGPHLPDENRLHFISFFNQHAALDVETGHQVTITLTTQPRQPGEKNVVPLIFDIDAVCRENAEPGDWPWILSKLLSLRSLKNDIFKNTLTAECLNLFRQ
jgi:uncharacterized protein (TIGR04255 family)